MCSKQDRLIVTVIIYMLCIQVTAQQNLSNMIMNIKYSGEVFGLMDYLKQYEPQVRILKPIGKVNYVWFNIDTERIYLDDLISMIDKQSDNQVNLIYDRYAHTLRVAFTPKISSQDSVIKQSINWQHGTTPLPVLSKDGVIRFPYGEYMPNAICKPLNLCDIELEPGEEIYGIVIGDSEHWNSGDQGIPIIYSGMAPKLIPHLVLKPDQNGLNTSLLITTSKRTYMIKLQSSIHEYTARIGFYYPSDTVQYKHSASSTTSTGHIPIVNLQNIDYDYTISSNSYSWAPTKVLNDGVSTYVQLPTTVDGRDLPHLCVDNHNQGCELVNFKYIDHCYVVEQIFSQAKLINGFGRNAQTITIKHRDKHMTWWEKLFE
jgi:P-type conjugative transfer protein TrbG